MTDADRNIAVLLTPPGAAAISVIRLSGPLNTRFAENHLARPPKSLRCVHSDVVENDAVLDDAVVVRLEDGTLDLNVHGGAWVVQSILQLARTAGYELGTGPIADVALATDEIEWQMIIDLPAARSRVVLRLLCAQPQAWRDLLARPDAHDLQRALADTSLERALTLPTVAIVGPANVGKSTLANALFGQERVITADVPGTTRDWVGELADLDGLVVRLVDTPGLRQTSDPIEAAAIDRAGTVVAAADLIVVAIDGSTPLPAEAAGLLSRFPEAVVVLTKTDLPIRCEAPAALGVSAVSGSGLADLRQALRGRLGCDDLLSPHARCWTAEQRRRVGAMLPLPDASSTIARPAPDRPNL
ncbi:MAG TPA: GTPase [Tepidisphaeraceae bacterium]